jgi:F-box and WD-40 domain protein MET30
MRHEVALLQGHEGWVYCLQFSPDHHDTTLVSGCADTTVKWWDLGMRKCLRTGALHTAEVFDLQFDEHRLVTASGDHSLRIWNMQTGACIGRLEGHAEAVTAVSLQQRRVVSGSWDETLRVWHFGSGTKRKASASSAA